MRMIYAAAALVAFAATPAFAQESRQPFDGGHIGVVAGYDSLHGAGVTSDGIAYGVQGGYDFRLGGAVLGLEAEAAESSTDRGPVEAGRDLYAGGRIGAVVGGRGLLYAKLGYTNARLSAPGAGVNLDGIRAGAGIEWMVGRNVSVRAEYRYSNYEDGLSRNQGILGLSYRF